MFPDEYCQNAASASAEHSMSVLDDVNRMIIDSVSGYKQARDMVKDKNPNLHDQLESRARERSMLLARFRSEIRYRGGEPSDKGSYLGELTRGYRDFMSLFSSDTEAALDAINECEDHLIDGIEDKMTANGLDDRARALLEIACLSAEMGERFSAKLAEAA